VSWICIVDDSLKDTPQHHISTYLDEAALWKVRISPIRVRLLTKCFKLRDQTSPYIPLESWLADESTNDAWNAGPWKGLSPTKDSPLGAHDLEEHVTSIPDVIGEVECRPTELESKNDEFTNVH
jgi:hypothetical protein